MRSWTIGEVARLLGVKPHVLRYWEGELPLLSPRKSLSGRREYSGNEVRLLMRFRHLLYEKKFTIEGAKRRIWEELGGGGADLAAKFSEIRNDLMDVLMTARRGVGFDDGEDMSERDLRRAFAEIGQSHLFEHWPARPEGMRRRLLEDLAGLSPAAVDAQRARLEESLQSRSAALGSDGSEMVPAPYVSLAESAQDGAARELGESLIAAGRCAALTVAGGQGSRLGFEGPKGLFPVTPIRKLTLFALFAEKIQAARRRYGASFPWLIMTGPHNHRATEEYFESQRWFGLGQQTVRFFLQRSLPSLTPDAKLIMAADGGLFTNPNGHGGVVEALRSAGVVSEMQALGVEELFYFQVDNPLVKVPDPTFLGFHRRASAEISCKVIEKAYPEEKLGVIVLREGIPAVIEYSDLDESRMHSRTAEGRLQFSQGSIAIHLINVAFLARPDLQLPYHLARKRVRALRPTSTGADTIEVDAIKMEQFIFDAVPLARRALFFETDRAEEFAPLKNREGLDSVATCVAGQVEQAARWLTACGVAVPRDAQGRPAHALEISPLFAPDLRSLASRRGSLPDRIDGPTLLA